MPSAIEKSGSRQGHWPQYWSLRLAGGGVLIHGEPRQALAVHLWHLNPGDIANVDVQSSALDVNGSGDPCPREGALMVTALKGSVAQTLPLALRMYNAPISSVD